MTENELTVETLSAEIERRLDGAYDLVYVDYRDELTSEQVSWIASGDTDSLFSDDDLMVWESDQRWTSACDIVDETAREIFREYDDTDELQEEFQGSDERMSLIELVQDRDRSDWLTQLARQTPAALLRITALDEDHGYAFEAIDPADMLSRLGVGATAENVETVRATLLECSPEYSVCLAYWIVGADVSALLDLTDAELVELVDPYLYVGNPFTGSGWISETPIRATVRVPRADVRTDEQAFGYSVDKIYGGLNASSFTAEVRPVVAVTP